MFEAKYERIYIDEKTSKLIEGFWKFFQDNEEKLVCALYQKDQEFLSFFDQELKKVFYRYQKGLRYTFFKENDTLFFRFFFGRNSYLLTVSNELFSLGNKELKYRWFFESLKD